MWHLGIGLGVIIVVDRAADSWIDVLEGLFQL